VQGFINNSSPLPNENPKYEYLEKTNFSNLKTQCAWIMAQQTNNHKVKVSIEGDMEFQEAIAQELQTYKIKNADDDMTKLRLESKEIQKGSLGRSPDYGDAFIMRGFFELKKEFRALTPEQEKAIIRKEIADQMDFDQFDVL
jgi:hypothetical protein